MTNENRGNGPAGGTQPNGVRAAGQRARGDIGVDFEEVDVPSLLRSSLEPLIEQARQRKVELRVESMGTPPKIAVDPEKLAWAVATLAGNALRYVKSGDAQTAGGSVLVHIEEDDDGGLAVAIQDDGPGIPPSSIPRLFERQTGATHAAGLGLCLVREVIEAHGGQLDVESRSDPDEHGTSITVKLPRGGR